jgi:hypothetical protein
MGVLLPDTPGELVDRPLPRPPLSTLSARSALVMTDLNPNNRLVQPLEDTPDDSGVGLKSTRSGEDCSNSKGETGDIDPSLSNVMDCGGVPTGVPFGERDPVSLPCLAVSLPAPPRIACSKSMPIPFIWERMRLKATRSRLASSIKRDGPDGSCSNAAMRCCARSTWSRNTASKIPLSCAEGLEPVRLMLLERTEERN